MRSLSLPSKPVDLSLDGFVDDWDFDVEDVGVVVVVGVAEVVGVRLCIGVFGTLGAVEAVFEGAVEFRYTITASAFRSVTVVLRAERDPSSLSRYPGSASVTTAAPPLP